MTHFVYKITRNATGKVYYGVHQGEIDDGYLGSGVHITRAIKKHGKEAFTREIVAEFDTKEEAYALEKFIVTPQFLLEQNTYNKTPGGKGGWGHIDHRGNKNPMKRPEVAAKVAMGIRASITAEERAARAIRMREMVTSLATPPRLGKTHTAEARAKISAKNSGRPSTQKGVKRGPEPADVRERKRLAAKNRVAMGFDMGALGRGKTYNMKKMQCPHCGIIGSGGNMTRFHFDNCKSK